MVDLQVHDIYYNINRITYQSTTQIEPNMNSNHTNLNIDTNKRLK